MPHPHAARWLGGITLLLLGLAVWQAWGALRAPSARQDLRESLTAEAFLAGRSTATVNRIMAHDLPADGVLRAAGGVLRWEVFGSGGPQVRPGCPGWLFLTEELRPWPGGDAALESRAAGLLRLAEGLRARGVTLLVLLTPDKARVQAGQLCGARYAAQAAARHAAFTARLGSGGLGIVDVLAPLQVAAREREVYFRTDTHWNPEGAGIAARQVAAAAAGLAFSRAGGFRTETPASPAPRPGDLLRLMGLDQVPDAWRPPADLVRLPRTIAPEAAGGLLDDVAVPEVVLLGSSFSLNSDFHGQLQVALGASVANLAQAGGGFAGSAIAYFASAAWRETPPRLIIWEVLERALTQPIGAAEQRFLAAPLP